MYLHAFAIIVFFSLTTCFIFWEANKVVFMADGCFSAIV